MNALSDALSQFKGSESFDRVGTARNFTSVLGTLQDGESSGCALTATSDSAIRWYVLRGIYNSGEKMYRQLQAYGFETYFPKRTVVKYDGELKYLAEEPYIPNLAFVHSSRKSIDDFLHEQPNSERYIKYYLDKTRGLEWNGKNPPLTVDDREMADFKKVCDTHNEHIVFLRPEKCRLTRGERVLVTDGVFKGVEGRYIRALGQWRVAIALGCLGYVGTAYVPKEFVRVIPNE